MSRLPPLLLLLILLLPSTLQAAALHLDDTKPMFSTAGYLEGLADPGGQFDVAQANAAQGWQKLPSNLNAGYTPNTYWLRLRLDVPQLLPGGWMLHLSNALLDDVRVYTWAPGGWQLLGLSGENVSRSEWPVDYRSAVIPFEPTEASEHTLLIRLESKNSLATRVEIWQRLAFDDNSRREGLFFGLHFGFYLLLIGLHAIFWAATRSHMSGLFLLYISLSLLNEVLSLGLIQQISGLPVTWSDRLLGAGFACNLLVGFRVSMQQLGMPILYPRTSLWLDHTIKVAALYCLSMALLNNYSMSVVPVLLLGMVMMVGFSSMCIWLLIRGYRHARFFALAFGIFYAGLLIGFLRNLGYLPVNAWTELATTIATMLHMILLSLWLITRYERKRRSRERWQANRAANMAQQHSQELTREVEQRTADLRQEIHRRKLLEQELRNALELEQRVRTEQQDFVAMVSHEFRTPLAIITTLSQRIEQGTPPQTPKNAERCQQIRNAASRLLALVDEYLSDDRMGESPVELKHAPYDLPALLEDLSGDFAPGRIRNHFHCKTERLVTDAGLLHIALRNLLANADRHSPANETVEVDVNEDGDFLLIDICNVSSNIPAHERERLFRKYFRGQNAKHATGAGLGLYLVQRISEMLGGDVTLLSAGGEQGVCFRLRLPKTPAPK
ncbi:histidine kinase [Ectopseudomonas composti]|uniref:histidine kinase n=1 Tax=Ectopseudomonas composti TaxID=658457 RepID=A0ABP3BSD7_9GAMM|nr:sensor histidine kinase [Pseudomonas composti]EZH78446.1 histidine kinase [Pseudomonas composti]